jgi:hypothetical protein
MLPGGLVAVLLLLPNVLWMILPPRGDAPTSGHVAEPFWRALEIVEWLGRIAALVIPFFYRITVREPWQVVALVVTVLALLFYYAGWVRYFCGGRRHTLLFAPLAGVPVPLAISPIVYLLGASALLGSWPLAVATAVLGAAHVPISWRDYRSIQGDIT